MFSTNPIVVTKIVWLFGLVSLAIASTSDFEKLALLAILTCGRLFWAPEMYTTCPLEMPAASFTLAEITTASNSALPSIPLTANSSQYAVPPTTGS